MHEVLIIKRTGGVDIMIDARVCTCAIGQDHDRVNGKNVKPVTY